MTRKRMICPEFWEDEKLGENVPPIGRLLFMGLISNADDEGRLTGNTRRIKSTIFPYDDFTDGEVEELIKILCVNGFIVRYVVGGQTYIKVVNFSKHQTINHPSKSKIPEFEGDLQYDYGSHLVVVQDNYSDNTGTVPEDSNGTTRQLQDDSLAINITNVKEINRSFSSEVDLFFQDCWGLYPEKTGKKLVSDKQKNELFGLGDQFKRCITRYVENIAKVRAGGFNQRYQKGSTFFNSGYVDYLDQNYNDASVVTELKAITRNTVTR